jgi:hypothetical protein
MFGVNYTFWDFFCFIEMAGGWGDGTFTELRRRGSKEKDSITSKLCLSPTLFKDFPKTTDREKELARVKCQTLTRD